jgi:hypothetical protein
LKWMRKRTIVIKFSVPPQHILGAIWQNQNETLSRMNSPWRRISEPLLPNSTTNSCAKVLFKIYPYFLLQLWTLQWVPLLSSSIQICPKRMVTSPHFYVAASSSILSLNVQKLHILLGVK